MKKQVDASSYTTSRGTTELLVKKSVKIWPVHGAFNHLLTQNIVWKTHTSASYRYVATDLRSQGIPTKTTNLANSY